MSLYGLMNQTIGIYNKSAFNEFGAATHGQPTAAQARVQRTTKQRLVANGDIVVIELIAYLKPTETIAVDDKVKYEDVDYRVFARHDAVDGDGQTNHIKLELTKWRAA